MIMMIQLFNDIMGEELIQGGSNHVINGKENQVPWQAKYVRCMAFCPV